VSVLACLAIHQRLLPAIHQRCLCLCLCLAVYTSKVSMFACLAIHQRQQHRSRYTCSFKHADSLCKVTRGLTLEKVLGKKKSWKSRDWTSWLYSVDLLCKVTNIFIQICRLTLQSYSRTDSGKCLENHVIEHHDFTRGLPWKRVWYVWGLPWKLVWSFGSRNYKTCLKFRQS